jgi:hypothetical protein
MAEYAVPSAAVGNTTVDTRSDWLTVTERLAVAMPLALSATCAKKLVVPATVGVPEITPVLDANDNPGGKLPELMLHVYGAVPLVAASVCVYAVLVIALGKLLGTTLTTDAAFTVML